MEIPKQIQDNRFRFIKLREGKIPAEPEWQKKNNYQWYETAIQSWIKSGNNYGVVCGSGLVVIDADEMELREAIISGLPKTFTVRTGKGMHFYYFCPIKEKIIYSGKGKHWGELQTDGQQVVGPGSLHVATGKRYEVAEDIPIATITKEQVAFALKDFMKEEVFEKSETKREHNNINLKMEDVCDTSGLSRKGGELQGPHPIHGSDGGMNFRINDTDNMWHCFRHDSGGGPLQWIAVKENIISCEDAKRGCIRGNVFRKVLKVAKEKYGLKDSGFELTLKDASDSLNDYLQLAEKFIELQPLFFDRNRNWWIWNDDKSRWEETDETEIMNHVDRSLQNNGKRTTESGVKNEILEALRRKARLSAPIPIKDTWVQFRDKLIDISSGEEIPVSSQYFTCNSVPWKLGKTEDTPTMDRLLTEWVGADHVNDMYEYIAFSTSTKYFINRFWFFVGPGCNGKSTFFNMVRKFLGNDNVTTAELDTLVSNNFHSYKLYKKLACFMGETNFGMLEKTGIIKRLTGDDLIHFEKKHGQGFDDFNYAKVWIATNTIPDTSDKTVGWFRRFIDVDFLNDFSGREGDVVSTIPDEEYENLALKSVRILKKLFKARRFTNEPSNDEKEARYEAKANPLSKFIKERFDASDPNAKMPFFEFYDMFAAYLKENKKRDQTKNEVSRRLKEMGYELRQALWKKNDDESYGIQHVWGIQFKRKVPIVEIVSRLTLFPYVENKVNSGTIHTTDTIPDEPMVNLSSEYNGVIIPKCFYCSDSNREVLIEVDDLYHPGQKLWACKKCREEN